MDGSILRSLRDRLLVLPDTISVCCRDMGHKPRIGAGKAFKSIPSDSIPNVIHEAFGDRSILDATDYWGIETKV